MESAATSSSRSIPPTAIEMIARCVWVDRGRVLVCRNLEHGYSYLPGGHVDPGERAEEAVVRELMEEAGLTIRSRGPIACFELLFEQEGRPRHELTFLFHVEHPPPTEIVSLESHIAFEWVELAALIGEDLRPGVLKAWLMSNGEDPAASVAWISHSDS